MQLREISGRKKKRMTCDFLIMPLVLATLTLSTREMGACDHDGDYVLERSTIIEKSKWLDRKQNYDSVTRHVNATCEGLRSTSTK